ncbi:MAG TPA: YceI family protein [Rhodocyclaceae bacterium]|nr:YceI family protein [Rhodocyclaceae bacterium]
MLPRHLGVLLAVVMVGSTAVAADRYTIDPNFTVPTFEIAHLGITTQQGRFNRASGTVLLDFAAGKGSVDLTIDTTSLDMSSSAWTKHLSDPGLFDVEKYPTMKYKSSSLVFKDGKVVGAEGEFTMLGVTRPLHVDVIGFRCVSGHGSRSNVCGGDVTATIRRSEFGMTKYIPEVSDDIRIRVPVEAYRD